MAEQWRPQFHFTAEKNQINDPNGLVYHGGQWHLFHQYNQHEAVHWGHATSIDLIHWRHLPPALFPDALGQIYSGTAVVDTRDDSGLRSGEQDVIVAFFTHAAHDDGAQSQSIAYSNDGGRSWCKHPRNPIIANHGRTDFRDPKVFWHEPSAAWVLVVTGGDHLEFFRSTNLLDWTFASSWGAGHGSHGGVWECPDLFELPVEGTTESRWVVSVSVASGAPAGGSGMQYFVGDFDGFRFTNDNHPSTILWQSWGKDYYAGLTWTGAPDQRRVMIAWADNWVYRDAIPTSPFNGQLTVPRELALRPTPDGPRLVAEPVRELESLRADTREWQLGTTGSQLLAGELWETYEVLAELNVAESDALRLGVEVHVGAEHRTFVGFDTQTRAIFIDRTQSGQNPDPAFPGVHAAPYEPEGDVVRLRLLVDRSSVEVFVDGTQLTDLVLPGAGDTGFAVRADDGQAVFGSLAAHRLRSIWPERHVHLDPLNGQWARTVLGLQGSHEGRATALVGTGSEITATVEIVGSREGNPVPILDERAAGLVLGTGADSIAVTLNRERSSLEAINQSTGERVATAPFLVQTNRPYALSVHWSGGELRALVDGVQVVSVRAPRRSGPVGLLVDSSEAVFTHLCVR